LFLLTGSADYTVVCASFVKRTICFIQVHTDVNLRTEAKALPYVIDARQTFFAFIITVAVPLPVDARATLGAVIFVTRLKCTSKFLLHTHIDIPPPIECGSYIVQADQIASTFFVAVTVALACFTRSTKCTVVIVSFVNGAGIPSTETDIDKPVQFELEPVVIPANKTTLAVAVRITIPFSLAARTTDQAEVIVTVFKGAVSRTGCNR
jgi:hypothetical protein